MFVLPNVSGSVTTRIVPVGIWAFLFLAGGLEDLDFLFLFTVFSLLADLGGEGSDVARVSLALSSLSGDACDGLSSSETYSCSFLLTSSLEPMKKR